ncbi:MAG TPA: hypothetical protein VFO19_14555 [Vicinamibacterales bacterium]|nr:hypothetical protein [Vicinamibacterales bacterium]
MPSDEWALILRPRAVYRHIRPVAAAYIPAYILWFSLVIAVAIGSSATARLHIGLVASLAFMWAFVPVIHVAAALALIATAPRRAQPVGPAVALLLMGHGPWSLALLTIGALGAAGLGHWFELTSAIVAIAVVLTVRIVYAYCVEVLAASAVGAGLRAAAHQALTYAIAVLCVDWAVGGLAQRFGP